MTILLANNVSSALAAPITASATSMTVTDGSRFPVLSAGQYFYATIIATNGIVEIVKVNTRNGNAMSITRAQDGTNAQAFASGARVEMRINAASVKDVAADTVAPIDARLTTAESDITALEGRMTTAEGNIVSLDGRLDIAEPEIDVLQAFDTTLGTSAGSNSVGFLQAGTGATARTVQGKLRDTVSVKDFGAVGDGTNDDTEAIEAAIDAVSALGGGTVNFVNGETYLVSNIILLRTNVSLVGNGCTISVNPLNYTGGITRFWGVFSTVNIVDRPEVILWRIGTGIISFENILIDGFTFQINRNGNVLTSGQMDLSEMMAVRFEDARNCKVTNCRFISQETIANNNGTPVVFFVRSEMCEISYCYALQTSLVYVAECKNCAVIKNTIPISVGTGIETVAGQSLSIIGNKLGITWWEVSAIGINTRQCQIEANTVDEAPLTGITIGHPTPTGNANFYNLPLDANFTTCRDNYILSGSTQSTNHGYIGVLIQAGSFVTVTDNVMTNLRKKVDYTSRAGGVLVQPDNDIEAAGLRIEKNRVNGANTGVCIVQSLTATISENSIADVYAGIVVLTTTQTPKITVQSNFVTSAIRAVSFANGYVDVVDNYFTNISDATFAIALTRGHFRYENNYMTECGALFLGAVKSFTFTGNVIENSGTTTQAANMDNSSLAGTATIDKIIVFGNVFTGPTNLLRLVNVLGQSTRFVENTVPLQFRTTSYNVGSLPTSSAGLSTGDLWNDTGMVRVV